MIFKGRRSLTGLFELRNTGFSTETSPWTGSATAGDVSVPFGEALTTTLLATPLVYAGDTSGESGQAKVNWKIQTEED